MNDKNIDGEDYVMIPEQAKEAQKRKRRTCGEAPVRASRRLMALNEAKVTTMNNAEEDDSVSVNDPSNKDDRV